MRIVAKPYAVTKVADRLGISRDELSRRMGVATTTAWRVDAAGGQPSARFIAALIAASGQTFEQLFEIVTEDAA